MQITTRGSVLAVALLASAPLLAAGSGTSATAADVPTQETPATTEQDDCWIPTLVSTGLSDNLAGFRPKPGGSPDSAGADHDPSGTAPCPRPSSLGNDDPEEGDSPKRGYAGTAMPARMAVPDLGTALFWKAYLMQSVFLNPGMDF